MKKVLVALAVAVILLLGIVPAIASQSGGIIPTAGKR